MVQQGLGWRFHGAAVKCYTHRQITLAPVLTQRAPESVPWSRSPVTDKNLMRLHRKGDEAYADVTPPPLAIATLTLVCVFFFFLHFRPISNRTIAAVNRITVCFHAVLSKDFKADPKEDQIFVMAGPPLGKWDKEPAVELSFTRYS